MNTASMRILDNANIQIYETGYFQDIKNLQNLNRTLPFYVMSYVLKGEAILSVDKKEYSTGPGSVIIVPRNKLHSHYSGEKGTWFMWWHFNYMAYNTIDVMPMLKIPLVSTLGNRDEFENAFHHYWCQKEIYSSISDMIHLKALELNILSVLFKQIALDNGSDQGIGIPPVFFEIFDDIARTADTHITLNDLSNRYYLHPTYISNKFTEFFGTSPIAMHHEVLHERAKYLLRSTDSSVTAIAEILGFQNSSSFSRSFHKKSNLSPSEYRRYVRSHDDWFGRRVVTHQ